ncbi:MAG: hypothetical protein ACOC7K_02290 [bacterium]
MMRIIHVRRGEDKTGKKGEAGVLVYTSMQPDAVQSPPRPAING